LGHPVDLRPAGSDWITRELADVRREVNELRAARGLASSATQGGAFIFQDSDGDPRWTLGTVNLDGSISGVTGAYGIFSFGDDGAIILAAREGDRGLVYPAQPFPFHDLASKTVTSGTFAGLWEALVNFPAYEVLQVRMAVICPAATTAEVRLIDSLRGNTTDVAAVPASFNGYVQFAWLHPAPCGLYDPRPDRVPNLFAAVQARRVSGTGNVLVFPPQTAELTSRFFLPAADATGVPTLLS
jgi:hypothetical protein